MKTERVLLLPGWMNSAEDHWQSLWERQLGHERVEQSDWEWPRRGDWMARLEEVLLEDDRPTLLVAHSLGCHLVAGWAEHSSQKRRVTGALLVAPPDASRLPPQLHNWRQAHEGQGRGRLPFPSITVISSNDPYCSLEEGSRLAADWGSRLVLAASAGHLNEAARLGDWPEGQTLLAQLHG